MNGLYGAEHWTAPTGVIGCAAAIVSTENKIIKKMYRSLCCYRQGGSSTVLRKPLCCGHTSCLSVSGHSREIWEDSNRERTVRNSASQTTRERLQNCGVQLKSHNHLSFLCLKKREDIPSISYKSSFSLSEKKGIWGQRGAITDGPKTVQLNILANLLACLLSWKTNFQYFDIFNIITVCKKCILFSPPILCALIDWGEWPYLTVFS